MKILFVCTGNTCRSPMAEAILQSKQNGMSEVRSAGIHTVDGLPISRHAQSILQDLELPYSETSKLIDSEDVAWADYILTMTANHQDLLRQSFPAESHKIHTLKGLIDESEAGDVIDPYGGDLSVYKKTFTELEQLIEKLQVKLYGG